MTWPLTWRNLSVATLNATLQLLIIYRLMRFCVLSFFKKLWLKGFIGIDLPFTVNVFRSPLPNVFQYVMPQP